MPPRRLPPPPTAETPVAGVPGQRRPRAFGATRLQVYLCGGHGDRLGWSFARGAGARLVPLAEPMIPGWDVWLWGLLRGTVEVIAAAQRTGRRWWYADHAYMRRGHDAAHYRVTAGGWQLSRVLDVPEDRWRRLAPHVPVRSWRADGGRHVLVCPPTWPVLQATGAGSWLDDTLAELAKHTDRPIRVRHKHAPDNPPLSADLDGCHALVTQHSMAAVEAVLAGVPVVVASSSAAAPVGVTDLALIEHPVRPDRTAWACSLAYGQFHLDEFGNGTAWRILKETQRGLA
jgi:hypothetical protein